MWEVHGLQHLCNLGARVQWERAVDHFLGNTRVNKLLVALCAVLKDGYVTLAKKWAQITSKRGC